MASKDEGFRYEKVGHEILQRQNYDLFTRMTKIQHNLTGSLRLLNNKSSLVDKLTADFKKLCAINNEYLIKLNTLENDSKIFKRLYGHDRFHNEPPVQLLSKTSDLLEIGALCKAENHKAVIDEYQIALHGLVERLIKYEGTKEEDHLDSKNDAVFPLNDSIASKEFVTYTIYEEEVASHNCTKQLLEKSENSISQILRKISKILGFTPKIGSNLMSNNFHQILEERDNLSAEIVVRIKDLQASAKDKEILMQNNKTLTEELQEAKKFVLDCNKNIESLNLMVVNQKESLRVLKDVGKRYKSNLIKEKRLNENIKMNKTFHLEKEYSLRAGWPHHDCLAEKKRCLLNLDRKVELKKLPAFKVEKYLLH